jgi:triacylglycerol lipase
MAQLVTQQSDSFQSEPLSIRLDRPIAELSWISKSLLFAELSRLSYGNPETVRQIVAAANFDRCDFLEDSGAEVYVWGTRYDMMVVCRGTEPTKWDDIQADANAWTVAMEIGRIHSGFHGHVDVLWPRIETLLKDNKLPVWFAGHSLGGAMATLCAARCKWSEIESNPRAIYTFGSPRVGDRKFVKFLRTRHFRWVNNNDIVPRVPPRWLGYRHVGKEIYLSRRGRIRSLPTWLRVHDQWRGFIRSLKKWKLDHLSDHSMMEYITHIRAYHEEEKAGKKFRGLHSE